MLINNQNVTCVQLPCGQWQYYVNGIAVETMVVLEMILVECADVMARLKAR